MVESKFSKNVHLAPYPTAVGVPAAVGHSVRGDANSRLYWPVLLGACRRGAQRQDS
jgi:hypothetical protein